MTRSIKDCGECIPGQVHGSCLQSTQTANNCFDDGCVSININYNYLTVDELNQYGQLMKHFVGPHWMGGPPTRYETQFPRPLRSYSSIPSMSKAHCYGAYQGSEEGVYVWRQPENGKSANLPTGEINITYTSQIGQLKYMGTMGAVNPRVGCLCDLPPDYGFQRADRI